jgi:hypothetical protein
MGAPDESVGASHHDRQAVFETVVNGERRAFARSAFR